METIVWQSIVIGLMLAIGFGVSAYRLYTIPRPSYQIQVKVYKKSILLLVFRILAFVLFLVVFMTSMYNTNFHDLVYYTYWNFTIQIIYISWAIIDQVKRWVLETNDANRPLNALFDTVFTSCLVVCFVYWAVLFDPAKPVYWTTYVVHGVNLVLFVIEFIWNEHLVQRNNMKFVVMWPAFYGAITWITMATGLNDTWPYSLLDVSKPLAPVKWFGIAAGHAVAFGVVLLFSFLKFKVFGVPVPAAASSVDSKVEIKVVPNTLV